MASNSEPSAANVDGSSDYSTKPFVMQIIVRRDLLEAGGWGVGPLMAQAAHAAVAVTHETKDRPDTMGYLSDFKNMHKVVMQTSSLESLHKLSDLLSATDPPTPHHVWIEQPENIPTCLAIAPNRKETPIKKALDKSGCRVWKG